METEAGLPRGQEYCKGVLYIWEYMEQWQDLQIPEYCRGVLYIEENMETVAGLKRGLEY